MYRWTVVICVVICVVMFCLLAQDGNENPVHDQEERVFVDRDAGVIHFRPLDRGDEGEYRCEAENQAGSASTEGFFDVISKS